MLWNENFEFKSPINPWNPQPKYRADFDKIKCLEIMLTPGKMLYIPAYWWYTFKFDENTSVSCFKYRTYMNNIAISPKICMYALQNQNVERKIAKSIDTDTVNKIDKKYDSTSINELEESKTNSLDEQLIPQILVPKEDPEPMPQFDLSSQSIINNNNLETIDGGLHMPP